jgi:hypothetical protein
MKGAMSTPDARRALGAFSRAHRERLPPSTGAVGRRRTPGLRREEIAEACGASLTWIAWLEQGREGGARRFRQSTLVFASHPEAKLVCLTPIDG